MTCRELEPDRLFAEQYAYRLMLVSAVKACRELLQQGVQRLFEGYRAYATTTTPAWMQAVDAAAVRQV